MHNAGAQEVADPVLWRRSGAHVALAAEVASSLRFAPDIVALAGTVCRNLTAGRPGCNGNAGRRSCGREDCGGDNYSRDRDGGQCPVNGLHMRIEGDAQGWVTSLGGLQVCNTAHGILQNLMLHKQRQQQMAGDIVSLELLSIDVLAPTHYAVGPA